MPERPEGTCSWPGADARMIAYHDEEWGLPVRDSQRLFEKLTLDGFQAGLSWSTILNKREGFRAAFEGFDPERVARYGDADIARLLGDASIVRHRGKIEATIGNARALCAMREAGTDFSDFLWELAGGRMVVNRHASLSEVAAQTDTSRRMSKELKKVGFRFVGPTTVYAFMQAVGMVNDHVVTCFRHAEVQAGDA